MAPGKRKTAAATINVSTADYDAMKVADLRKACEDAGIDSKGAKAALVKRLKENQGDSQPPTKLTKVENENTKSRKSLTKAVKKSKKTIKVDREVPYSEKYEVHEDYVCMLNQSSIKDNTNKYYIIQLLTNKKQYWTWTRWGRVGELGINKMDSFAGDLDGAIKAFKKKFQEKTKNKWENRENFEPVPGKYTLLGITGDVEEDDDDETGAVDEPDAYSPQNPCILDAATQEIIKIIFNPDMFRDAMSSMDMDIGQMPLGKLSKVQIAKGFEALVAIEEGIKKKKKRTQLEHLVSQFYTLIPHAFGRMAPLSIDSLDLLQEKKDMILVLGDIELALAMKMDIDVKKKTGELLEHPLDASFRSLGCLMELMDSKEKEYKIICHYIKATGPGHLKLLDMWRINREFSDDRFAAHDNIKNRKLLWHGTDVVKTAAILKNGLRIMPHSGGRVGKGIYFASEISQCVDSACPTEKWCYLPNEDEDAIGVVFLAEVALGNEKHVIRENFSLREAPLGYDSVVARGIQEPDPKKDTYIILDGKKVTVPQGKPKNQRRFQNSSFYQSEYLVYKESQVHLRYMLKFKFYVEEGW